jgi:hypothetical protein
VLKTINQRTGVKEIVDAFEVLGYKTVASSTDDDTNSSYIVVEYRESITTLANHLLFNGFILTSAREIVDNNHIIGHELNLGYYPLYANILVPENENGVRMLRMEIKSFIIPELGITNDYTSWEDKKQMGWNMWLRLIQKLQTKHKRSM